MTALNEISSRFFLLDNAMTAMPAADLFPLFPSSQSGGVETVSLDPNLISALSPGVLLRSRFVFPRINRLRPLSLSSPGHNAKQYLSQWLPCIFYQPRSFHVSEVSKGFLSCKTKVLSCATNFRSGAVNTMSNEYVKKPALWAEKIIRHFHNGAGDTIGSAADKAQRALGVPAGLLMRLRSRKNNIEDMKVSTFFQVCEAYQRLNERLERSYQQERQLHESDKALVRLADVVAGKKDTEGG